MSAASSAGMIFMKIDQRLVRACEYRVPFRNNREHRSEILKLPTGHGPSVGLDRDGADQSCTPGISKQSCGLHALGIGRVGVGHHIDESFVRSAAPISEHAEPWGYDLGPNCWHFSPCLSVLNERPGPKV